MKRILSIGALLSATWTLGCGALSTRVQVYGGETEQITTPAAFVAAAANAKVQAAAVRGKLLAASESTLEDAGKVVKQLDERSKRMKDASNASTFKELAGSYLAALKQYTSVVAASQKRRGALAKELDAGARALQDKGTARIDNFDDVSVESVAFEVIAGKLNKDQREWLTQLRRSPCTTEAACKSDLSKIKGLDAEKLDRLDKDLKAIDPGKIDWVVTQTKLDTTRQKIETEAKSALDAIKTSCAEKGELANALGGVDAAANGLFGAISTPNGDSAADEHKRKAALHQKVAVVMENVEAFTTIAKKQVEGLKGVQVVLEDAKGQLEGEQGDPSARIRRVMSGLQGHIDSIGESMTVTTFSARADLARGESGFRFVDPNLKRITSKAAEEQWRDIPVDNLEVQGDGTAHFVIVQESPVSYRLKQLQADPSRSVELALSVADVGLDVLKTYVLKGDLGPDQGKKDAGASAPVDAEPLVARNAELRQRFEVSRRQLVAALREAETKLATSGAADKQTVAQVQASLKAHVATFKALEQEISQLAKEPGAASSGAGDTGAQADAAAK